MQDKINQQPKSEKTNEEKIDARNETSSELDESIHHIKEIKKREEKSNHNTSTVNINGIKKEVIIDTGSPITIMPPDEKILKSTGIQKITKRCQDVNKNEVKVRENFPEDENIKQKVENLVTEKTDITPALGMDWMKNFKLTIGRIQLDENN